MPARRSRARSQPPSPDESAAPQAAEPCARLQRAQLRCYLCAETCGAVEGPSGVGLPAIASFFPADGSPPRRLAWRSLHCTRCGSGSLFIDEPETIFRHVERVDWELDQPRRGRPPRWLVERRAQRDAAA